MLVQILQQPPRRRWKMQATSCQAHDDNTACGVSDTVSKSADRQREWSDWLAHDDDISYFLGVIDMNFLYLD